MISIKNWWDIVNRENLSGKPVLGPPSRDPANNYLDILLQVNWILGVAVWATKCFSSSLLECCVQSRVFFLFYYPVVQPSPTSPTNHLSGLSTVLPPFSLSWVICICRMSAFVEFSYRFYRKAVLLLYGNPR